MRVEPVTGIIGASVSGVDLSRAVSESEAEALRSALDTHHVLFLEGQQLDRESLKRSTALFGPICRVPYVEPSPEDPDVIAVRKEAEEKNISVFGGEWHSDFSFLLSPPGGSLLYALEVPPYGGDTLWANQVAAWETLPDALRKVVEHRRAIHVGAPYGIRHAPPSELAVSASIRMTRNDPAADRERFHPAVRTHPRTRHKALFVNPIYTTGLEGLSKQDGREVLARIYRHATQPGLTCRYRWRPGSLAIWDNRTTLHYAVNDYDGFRRLLLRTTFAGERPI